MPAQKNNPPIPIQNRLEPFVFVQIGRTLIPVWMLQQRRVTQNHMPGRTGDRQVFLQPVDLTFLREPESSPGGYTLEADQIHMTDLHSVGPAIGRTANLIPLGPGFRQQALLKGSIGIAVAQGGRIPGNIMVPNDGENRAVRYRFLHTGQKGVKLQRKAIVGCIPSSKTVSVCNVLSACLIFHGLSVR